MQRARRRVRADLARPGAGDPPIETLGILRKLTSDNSRRLVAAGILLGGLTSSRGAPAGEDDTPEARAEALLALARSVLASEASTPSVLGDVDVRRADAATLRVVRALRSTKIGFDIEKQDLASVLTLFSKVSGIGFVMTARAAESAKAEKRTVTFSLEGLALENVLNLLMEDLREYRFAVRYGAIVCMLREEYKPTRVLRVYNVSDVVRPRPDFPAPSLGLGTKEESR